MAAHSEYAQDIIENIENGQKIIDSLQNGDNILLHGAGGCGKCLAPYEEILLFDGSFKEAQDIIQGDLLMGDDSTPRTVINTCTGQDTMYRIIPDKGESFVCNEPHILTLISVNSDVIGLVNVGAGGAVALGVGVKK